MSAIKGSKRTIAIEIGNVFRPFLDVEKYLLYEYAHKYNVPYIEDPTNYEVDGGYDNQRAFVRNVLLPNALIVNSGLFKTVRKFVRLKRI
jgi:tRNA(Ile)-lysidine synthase TilS/MesJ